MARIKFMGSSHVHTLKKGDDFGGQLSEGIPKEVVFDRSNNWVVDTTEAGLSAEAVKILVDSGDMKDVTDLKKIPANEHQKLFLGMSGSEDSDEVLGTDAEDKPEGSESATGSDTTAKRPGR